MKRTILIFIIILSGGLSSRAQTAMSNIWDEANTAYINGDYLRAIAVYDSILNAGYVSDKLYYNLGNAYFKEGYTGRAILNYSRALRLNPSDTDTKYNLAIANAHIKDRIEAVPDFFLVSWGRSLRTMMGSNAWAVFSLLFFASALGAGLLYLLSRRLSLRKTGFYSALACLALGLLSVYFSVIQKNNLTASSEAIVLSGAVPVKSSPDNNSKDIFIIHEGTKVRILSSLNGWREISIADGNKGWIREDAVETI